MKFSILGGGNGGFATSAYLSLNGFETSLFELPEFEENITKIKKLGGIKISADESTGLPGGFAKLNKITTNIKEAVEDADFIMIVAPSFAHRRFAEVCAPHLKEGQVIVLTPGNPGGALKFAKMLKEIGVNKNVILAETANLAFACRKSDHSTVSVTGYKKNLQFATFPSNYTVKILGRIKKAFPDLIPAKNVLETGLSNCNFILHPPLTILNSGWIELTKGNFLFYVEGATPSIAKVIESVDKERLAVGKALGLDLMPIKELLLKWYAHQGAQGATLYEVLTRNPAYRNIKAPSNLQVRYIFEDVPYGLVPLASIGDYLEVSTTYSKSFVNLSSSLSGVNYWREGITFEKMNLEGLNVDEIDRFLEKGDLDL